MAAKIDTLIPQQAWEVVRNKIGAILTEELDNQAGNLYNDDADAEVYIERFTKLAVSEDSVISVNLAEGTFDGQTAIDVNGNYTFNVDVFCKAVTTGKDKTAAADHLAMVKLNRLLGICRAILQDARYKTLGFTAPFVMSRQVTRVQIAAPKSEDEQSHVMGRLQIVVKVPETAGAASGIAADGVDTVVKLVETDLGYKFEFNA